MARNAAQRRGPGWLKLIGLGLVVVVGVGAAAIIVPPMLFEPAADVALIKAEDTPFKVKPKDPGGVEIPHAETTVMGMIDDLRQPEDATEVIRPPSAVPEMPPTPVDESADVAMAAEPRPATPALASDGSQTASAGSDNAAPNASTNTSTNTSPEAGTASETDAADDAGAAVDAASSGTAAPAPEAPVTAAIPQSKPKPPKRVVVEGDEPLYVVQLAAFRKADTAREQAGLLAGKHKGRLDGAELGTMKTDTGDDGIFWRVVTEPMARADADQVCAALKRAGQDCILRKYRADG